MFTNWGVIDQDISEESHAHERHADISSFNECVPTDIPDNATELETQIKELVIDLYSNEGYSQLPHYDNRRGIFTGLTSSVNKNTVCDAGEVSVAPGDCYYSDLQVSCSTPVVHSLPLEETFSARIDTSSVTSAHGNLTTQHDDSDVLPSGIESSGINNSPTQKASYDHDVAACINVVNESIGESYANIGSDLVHSSKDVSICNPETESGRHTFLNVDTEMYEDNNISLTGDTTCNEDDKEVKTINATKEYENTPLEDSFLNRETKCANDDPIYRIHDLSKAKQNQNVIDDLTQPISFKNRELFTYSVKENPSFEYTNILSDISSYDSGFDSWLQPDKEGEEVAEDLGGQQKSDRDTHSGLQDVLQDADLSNTNLHLSIRNLNRNVPENSGNHGIDFAKSTESAVNFAYSLENEDDLELAQRNISLDEFSCRRDECVESDASTCKKQSHNLNNRFLKGETSPTEALQEKSAKGQKINELGQQLLCLEDKSTSLEAQLKISENEVYKANCQLEKAETELGSAIKNLDHSEYDRKALEREVHELLDAKKKLTDDSEWYKFQLRILQESRLKMEIMIEGSKAKGKDDAEKIQQLNVEKEKLTNELFELKQKSLFEKQNILSQLEKVEEDLMQECKLSERYEKDITALQSCSASNEEKVLRLQDKIIEVCALLAKAEEEEARLRVSVTEKESFINELLEEKRHMEDRVNQQKQLLVNSDLEKESLQQKVSTVAEEFDKLSIIHEKSMSENAKLNNEVNNLKRDVAKGIEERCNFDQATLALKSDIQKMCIVFNIVRRQLMSKSRQIKEIDSKKKTMLEELVVLQDTILSREKIEQELRETIKEKSRTIEELLVCKREAETAMQEQKKLAKKYQVDLHHARKENMDLTNEKSDLCRSFEEAKEHLSKSRKETETFRDKIQLVESERASAVTSLELKLQVTFDEMTQLRAKYRSDVLKLETDLSTVQKVIDQKEDLIKNEQLKYEEEINFLVGRLEQEQDTRNKAIINAEEDKRSLLTRHARWKAIITKQFKQFKASLREIKTDNSTNIKDQRNFEIFFYKQIKQIQDGFLALTENINRSRHENNVLRTELTHCQHLLQKQKEENDGHLEHLRHVQQENEGLEQEVLKRRSEADSLQEETIKLHKGQEELEKSCNNVQVEYKRASDEFRVEKQKLAQNIKKINKEKNKLYELFRKKEAACISIKKELSLKDRALSKATKELEATNRKYDDTCRLNEAMAFTIDRLKATEDQLRTDCDMLRRENEAIIDEKRHLDWQHRQLQEELTSLQLDTNLDKSRQLQNMEHPKNALAQSKLEAQNIQKDLERARSEKLDMHGQLLDLREEIRNSRKELDELKGRIRNRNELLLKLKTDLADSQSRGVKELVNIMTQRFLVDVTDDEKEKDGNLTLVKPSGSIGTVRTCIETLRVELGELQAQMSFQTQSFEDSKNKWRKFDNNVDRLRTVCSNAESNDCDEDLIH